jgi:uncharacterized protein (TIGR03086 family)
MTEIADRYRQRADAFAALIANTAPERWDDPSPCEGWRARDIVAHIVAHSTKELREREGVQIAPSVAAAGDPAVAFRAIREAVERMLDDPATPTDVARYLDEALSVDLPQHWWDLAVATGQDATMDAQEIEFLWAVLSPASPAFWKWQVDNGHYAPAVFVPEDAPLQDRVLGLIGRDPHGTPPR